jgi:hypothetical protein
MSATAVAIDEQVAAAEDELGVVQVLDAVREFGLASLSLVAWEYCLPESSVVGAWSAALGQGLIERVSICEETGETLFALAG